MDRTEGRKSRLRIYGALAFVAGEIVLGLIAGWRAPLLFVGIGLLGGGIILFLEATR